MLIRKAKLSDVNKILIIWKEFIKEHSYIIIDKSPFKKNRRELVKDYYKYYEKWLKNSIRSKNGFVVIVEEFGKIIGFSLCRIKKYDKLFTLRKYGSINDIYVIPNYRGKNISSLLKNEAIKWFKSNNIKHISLSVSAENIIPQKIYKKWGFSNEYIDMWKDI